MRRLRRICSSVFSSCCPPYRAADRYDQADFGLCRAEVVECSRLVLVLYEDFPIVGRDVVLVWDTGISCRDRELQIRPLAYRHRIAIRKAGAPELELVASLLVPLKVSLAAPDIRSDEMALKGLVRLEPPSELGAEAQELETMAVALCHPPRSILLELD